MRDTTENGAISRFNTQPLYVQVRDTLLQRIESGEWKPERAIPNEGDLAREYGISAGTMRKTLDLMESEGHLSRKQGRGTFVIDRTAVLYKLMYTCRTDAETVLLTALHTPEPQPLPEKFDLMAAHVALALFNERAKKRTPS
jgi:DNA-binding GntR family transcriptional regulator